MMNRWMSLLLAVASLLLLGGSLFLLYEHEQNTNPWQEQYDLGVRYLSDGDYEEAIIAFKAAIEIDAKRSEAHLGLAETYVKLERYDRAIKTLKNAVEEADDYEEVQEALDELLLLEQEQDREQSSPGHSSGAESDRPSAWDPTHPSGSGPNDPFAPDAGLVGSGTRIPAVLTYSNWGQVEDYRPYIAFNQDMTCEVRITEPELVFSCDATYEVFTCRDGTRLIKVSGIDDGWDKPTDWFYLIETEDGLWDFWGETYGVISMYFDSQYEAEGDEQIRVKADRLTETTGLTGKYQDVEFSWNDLDVVEEQGDWITFNVFWYRTWSIDGAVGRRYGNLVFFEEQPDPDDEHKNYGVLEFRQDGTAILTLLDSLNSRYGYIEAGSYTYQFVSEEELSRQLDSQYLSYLQLSDETNGWLRREPDKYIEYDSLSGVYMHFDENGKVAFAYTTDDLLGAEIAYEQYVLDYRVEDQILYVGDSAYSLYMYSTGVTYMELTALYHSGIDLSGEYYLEEDHRYQALVPDIV